MLLLGEYLTLVMCIAISISTNCFYEEQSTTPMMSLSIDTGVPSWRKCVLNCNATAECVSCAYSDAKRICALHSHAPIEFPTCGVPPFRRFVKTQQNCVGSLFATYNRTDLAREAGIDPCFPDRAGLHSDLVKLDGASPSCPIRKLDGTQGPPLVYRGLDCNGSYTTLGTNIRAWKEPAPWNTWKIDLVSDRPALAQVTCQIAGACAEHGDECACPPLLPISSIPGGSPVTPNIIGACRLKTLHVRRYLFADPTFSFNGDTAKLFCSGGFWMAGENDNGEVFRIDRGICA